MNVLFLSPGFPTEMTDFVRGLAEVGASVYGIGDQPEGAIPAKARAALSGYVQVNFADPGGVVEAAKALAEHIHIDKVESLDGDPIELATDAIKNGFAKTRVDGRVLDVLINAEEPKHVVVYVRFQGSTQKDVVKDASTIASVVANKAPFVSTLSLSAIHPKAAKDNKTSVWSAKIGRQAMVRIQDSRINDYADRLYKGLFEGVEERPF